VTIFDVITCFVSNCDTGKINASDKIVFENQNKRKYENERKFYINFHLKCRLNIKCTAYYGELMPEEALTSFAVSLICGSGIAIRSESRSRMEYNNTNE